MNPRAWLADTLARHVEANGEIVAPWDDPPEEAIPISTLAHYAPLWRSEDEAADVRATRTEPVSVWVARDCEAVLGAMDGLTTVAQIEARLPHLSQTQIRARLSDLWAAGRVVRVTGRGYRLV